MAQERPGVSTHQIDIVIPVLDDLRVLDTVESVRFFDDIGSVRLIIIAGTSSQAFLDQVRPVLTDGDILSTEPDAGIFDALNKGLDLCTAPIMGWLGGDDVFTGRVRASDVVREFASTRGGILVYSTEYHVDNRISRRLSARYSRKSLIPWGFHNPHFSTFLAQNVYREDRFPISSTKRNQFSDIPYFMNLIIKHEVTLRSEVCTYMAEGGSASGTLNSVRYNLKQRYYLYRETFGLVNGIVAPVMNLAWKLASVAQYKIFRKTCEPLWRSAGASQNGT